jgi:hypothetical protein
MGASHVPRRRQRGGRNDGQLGDGSTTNSFSPVAVVGGAGFGQIGAATVSTCALNNEGVALCWGNNTGRFGNGQTGSSLTPSPVVFP